MSTYILGIESSCDDTSAAVICDGILKSNVIASQKVHEAYGGVVPELASRAHQQNIVPVVSEAIRMAGIDKSELSAIAFTRGPGLLGSLLVGTSFAKGMAIGLNIPLIDVNHLHAHVLSHFVKKEADDEVPEFPFLCLLGYPIPEARISTGLPKRATQRRSVSANRTSLTSTIHSAD